MATGARPAGPSQASAAGLEGRCCSTYPSTTGRHRRRRSRASSAPHSRSRHLLLSAITASTAASAARGVRDQRRGRCVSSLQPARGPAFTASRAGGAATQPPSEQSPLRLLLKGRPAGECRTVAAALSSTTSLSVTSARLAKMRTRRDGRWAVKAKVNRTTEAHLLWRSKEVVVVREVWRRGRRDGRGR